MAIVVTPYVIETAKKKLRESRRIPMGASRDNPPQNSLSALLKKEGLPPQILSYLGSILVAEGSCDYVKEGKRVIMLAQPGR